MAADALPLAPTAPPLRLVPGAGRAWEAALAALDPIGLAELDAAAALQTRVDRKYLVADADLAVLLGELAATHRVLEIDGLRAFRYRTTYYDTDDLLTYRMHVQGRRRRFKARKRRYVESGLSRFEVKLKGLRGRTEKVACASDPCDELTPADLAFLREQVGAACGLALDAPLRPVLTVRTRRLTVAAPALGERLTIDVALRLGEGRLADGFAIVESKSAGRSAVADDVLRTLGARPAGGCSKYLLGTALSRPGEVRDNPLRPLLRRYFVAAPVGASA
jgi:hypothetical protein